MSESDFTVEVPCRGSVLEHVEPYGNQWARRIAPWKGVLRFVEMIETHHSLVPYAFLRFEAPELGLVVPVRSDVFAEHFVSRMVFGEIDGEWRVYASDIDGKAPHFFVGPLGLEIEEARQTGGEQDFKPFSSAEERAEWEREMEEMYGEDFKK